MLASSMEPLLVFLIFTHHVLVHPTLPLGVTKGFPLISSSRRRLGNNMVKTEIESGHNS